jgi:hypothetical protein
VTLGGVASAGVTVRAAENSEVFPAESVAVAVITSPLLACATVCENEAFPAASVVTDVAPTNR